MDMHSISDAEYEEDDILSISNANYNIPKRKSISKDVHAEKQSAPLLDGIPKEYAKNPEAAYFFEEADHRPASFDDGSDEEIAEEHENDMENGLEEHEEIFRALDDFYVMMDRNGFQKPIRNKNRHKYGEISIEDMGVLAKKGDQTDRGEVDSVSEPSSPSMDFSRDENLPPGWEKHDDEEGPYYWHIRTGTIQRHPPEPVETDFELPESPLFDSNPASPDSFSVSSNSKHETRRYSVRSLGWREIDPESLTPEKSSKAVNRCILDLSAGRNDGLDGIGRWGDGKDIFLELYPDKICFVDSVDSIILHTQPIESIKVWGVGRDDSRDFAIVARDDASGTYRCHVLRCDMPARRIAHALKEICQDYIARHAPHKSARKTPRRPHTLSLNHRRGSLLSGGAAFLPTPTEEPKKIFRVMYVGRRAVKNGVGIENLHKVIADLMDECPEDQWAPVSVAVSPSTITISTQEQEPEVIAECRVRYLTFLGIGRDDVRTCGFMVHTPEDTFLAHVFACEPSGGPLCKAIEAACKLRYQKFLDAHAKAMADAQKQQAQTPTERIANKLKSLFKLG